MLRLLSLLYCADKGIIKSIAVMNPGKYSRVKLLLVLCFFLPGYLLAQEVRGLKIYVDLAAGTYLKFQKTIDGIEGSFRDKGYNYKTRSSGNALNILPPTDRPLEPTEIEITEGGRNHLFLITPYPKKYDPNIDPSFDYIFDNNDKIKKYIQQAEQDKLSGATVATKPEPQVVSKATEPVVEKPAVVVPKSEPKTEPVAETPITKPGNDGYDASVAAGDKAFNDKNYHQAKISYSE